ncbi:hypothetical protein K8353_33685 [Burkholderia contaminans]|nr:hypothetical protein [Burkholderia contaminans]
MQRKATARCSALGIDIALPELPWGALSLAAWLLVPALDAKNASALAG